MRTIPRKVDVRSADVSLFLVKSVYDVEVFNTHQEKEILLAIRLNRTHLLFVLSQLSAGGFFGLYIFFLCLSFASLIYIGDLKPYFTVGVGLILISAIMSAFVLPLASERKTSISSPQSDAIPMYMLMSSAIAGTFATQHVTTGLFVTVFTAIVIATTSTGLVFLLIGLFKGANSASFLPYPVTAGFFAGIGWLIFSGSLTMLTKIKVTYVSLPNFFALPTLLHWLPAFICFLLLYLCERKKRGMYELLSILFLAILLFYLVAVLVLHTPITTLQANGFLLNITPHVTAHNYLTDLSFRAINWQAILHQSSTILLIIFFSVSGILIKLSGLDIFLKTETDLNRELRVAGGINIACGLLGGIVEYASVNNTLLNEKTQRKNSPAPYLAGLFASAFCLILFFYGLSFVVYLPTFLLGGILMFLGFSLIRKGVIDTYKKMEWREYLIVLIILSVVIHYGIFQSVIVGILISIMFFVITYSRFNVIRDVFTGESLSSNKQREPSVQRWLSQHGNYLLYIKLQSYIFFGNAQILWQELKYRLSIDHDSLRYVICDFHTVVGIDSSAITTFTRIKQLAEKEKFTLIFIEMSKTTHTLMKKNSIIHDNDCIRIFSTYDEALQWCEEEYIISNNLVSRSCIPLETRLKELYAVGDVSRVHQYFKEIRIQKGEYLYHTNDPSDVLYYIESGYLTLLWDTYHDDKKRLRTVGPGNTIGEVGFYLQLPRPATVIANEDCVLQVLTMEGKKRMHQHDRELMIYFDMLVINILSERVIHSWGRQNAHV